MTPKISVIIPTYNRKEMLKEGIDSVLKQTEKSVEILVVDDVSTDGTSDMIEAEYGHLGTVRVIKNTVNRQAGYNRNLAYKQSYGDYLVFLDDDDYYTDNTFFEKALAIHASGDFAFVGANSATKYEDSGLEEVKVLNRVGEVDGKEYLQGFMTTIKKPNSTFTALFKRKNLEKVDFEHMRMMGDGPIYLRALLTGNAYLMEDNIGVYRIHKTNISFNLNIDFLLQTLDEKLWVYRETKKRKIEGIPEDWGKTQVITTIQFYITHSKPDRMKRKAVVNWVHENLPEAERETKSLIMKIRLKAIIKKLLGREIKL